MACSGDQARFPLEESYVSKPLSFTTTSRKQPFDLTFMNEALAAMYAPRLTSLKARLRFTNVTVANGPFPAKRLVKIIERLFVRDSEGPRYDVTGYEHGEIEYTERLNPQIDSDIANGDDIDIFLHFPVTPLSHPNPAKCRWELAKLLKGEISISTVGGVVDANDGAGGDPTIDVTASADGSMELWADIIDEGKDESKERIVYRGFPINNNYDNRPVVGRLRFAYQSIGEAAPAGAVWDTSQNITSRTLRMNSIEAAVLIDKYLVNVAPVRDRSDASPNSDDGVLQGRIIPVFSMRKDQSMTELAELKSLDWKTDDVFNAGTFQNAYQPTLICSWFESRADSHCEAGGMVQLANGREVPTSEVAEDLRSKLPVVGGSSLKAR